VIVVGTIMSPFKAWFPRTFEGMVSIEPLTWQNVVLALLAFPLGFLFIRLLNTAKVQEEFGTAGRKNN